MKGQTEQSVSFLKRFYPRGPWVLTAISVDRKSVDTKVFGPKSESDCYQWIENYNGERNIYFTVNQPFTAFLTRDRVSKPSKEDIELAHYLHVDIDPREGHEVDEEKKRILEELTTKLPKGLPEPTVILFSGGGLQAFWKLKEPVKIEGKLQEAENFELYNIRLEQIFDADPCHNVDRLMRLVGTVNVPNPQKIKKGRKPKLAELLRFSKSEYDIGEFKRATPVQTSGPSRSEANVEISANIEKIDDVSELDKWDVPERLKVIMAQGMHPDEPKEKDNSRSAWVFDFICGMTRLNVPDQVIYSILMDPEWPISESIVEKKGGAHKYAVRQISRAKEFTKDPILTEMNDKHAVIGNVGGRCLVISEIYDQTLDRYKLTFSSFESISQRYSNRQVVVGVTAEGKEVTKPLGKYWLSHPQRRQYDRIAFHPNAELEDVYNLWRGFSVQPRPGDCSLYLDHIRENICMGVPEYYDWVIGWMARAVQEPATQGEVAIVLRGGKGTGKGTFANVFGKLFGRHHLQISNAKHLVGNFNSHLKDCVSLFADEAFFAGDKQHEGVLKALITEDVIPIEHKGLDLEQYPNYVHLIMASNDPHVIRATGDERRYMVLDMGEKHKQDTAYFEKIWKQMENGGYEALLYFLQSYDISGFNVRKVPQTDALRDQKMLSMSQDEEWWFQKLLNGRVLEKHAEWQRFVPTAEVEKDFTEYAEKWRFNRRGNATQLGKFLSRVCPHISKTQRRMAVEVEGADGRPEQTSRRMYVYDFGDLSDCRAAWDRLFGETDWDDPVEAPDEDVADEVPF